VTSRSTRESFRTSRRLALATSWKRAGKTARPGPGEGDDAVLERLPQRLEHRALDSASSSRKRMPWWASVREGPPEGSPDTLRAVAVSADEARALALSLPEAVELDHHGRPSFRVGGKIFATLWNEGRMNVMLDEGGILTAVESAPDACEKVWWGKRLAAVGVTLARTERELLGELLTDAWEQKAPKRLVSG
jgi:hypothetical protein